MAVGTKKRPDCDNEVAETNSNTSNTPCRDGKNAVSRNGGIIPDRNGRRVTTTG